MQAVSTLRDRFEAMRDDGELGVFLSALALTFLAAGYAAGSVLAGRSLSGQTWAVPVVGGGVTILAMLAARSE